MQPLFAYGWSSSSHACEINCSSMHLNVRPKRLKNLQMVIVEEISRMQFISKHISLQRKSEDTDFFRKSIYRHTMSSKKCIYRRGYAALFWYRPQCQLLDGGWHFLLQINIQSTTWTISARRIQWMGYLTMTCFCTFFLAYMQHIFR